jgi:hypothetical protein
MTNHNNRPGWASELTTDEYIAVMRDAARESSSTTGIDWDDIFIADLDDPGPLAADFDREPQGPPVDIDWLAIHDGDYPHEMED